MAPSSRVNHGARPWSRAAFTAETSASVASGDQRPSPGWSAAQSTTKRTSLPPASTTWAAWSGWARSPATLRPARTEPALSRHEGGAGPQLARVVAAGRPRRARQLHHLDVMGEAPQVQRPVGRGDDALGQVLLLVGREEHLERAGGVAQAGGQVDGQADVVVPLEKEGVPAGDPDPQGERSGLTAHAILQVQCGGDAIGGVDGDDHATVPQPLGDAYAPLGGDVTGDRPEAREDAPGGIVAVLGGVVREPREVDEYERPGHPHH